MEKSTLLTADKLKWLGKPSQFGYIFGLLAQRGFIEFPNHKGKASYGKYAKICMELFDIKTTKENLEKELNPNNNSLSSDITGKFKIPDVKDI